jgi:hypothetical protein
VSLRVRAEWEAHFRGVCRTIPFLLLCYAGLNACRNTSFVAISCSRTDSERRSYSMVVFIFCISQMQPCAYTDEDYGVLRPSVVANAPRAMQKRAIGPEELSSSKLSLLPLAQLSLLPYRLPAHGRENSCVGPTQVPASSATVRAVVAKAAGQHAADLEVRSFFLLFLPLCSSQSVSNRGESVS